MLKIPQSVYALYWRSPLLVRSVIASTYAAWSGRKKYGRWYGHWKRFVDESRNWDRDAIRRYQVDRIRDLLKFVREESPFYADIIRDHRIDIDGPDVLKAIEAFPIIDRAVVRGNSQRIQTEASKHSRVVLYTSGTTGTPMEVPITLEAFQREYAFRWQFLETGGAARTDRFAMFTGHTVVPISRRSPPFWVHDYHSRTIMFSVHHMSDASMASYVEALNSFHPRFLFGYPSAIWVFARYVLESGKNVVPITAVFCSSEKLHGWQRAIIQRAFGAPVFEYYGQVENTVNVQECPMHRLHVQENYGYLQLLRDDGFPAEPGERGSVVATAWGNRAMPLIRYRTGDSMILARDQTCSCGRAGRIIEEIVGRDDDLIITPDGKYLGSLERVFEGLESVSASQILQEKLERLTVRVVARGGLSGHDRQVIRERLEGFIGPGMAIDFEEVERIAPEANGKTRFLVSRLGKAIPVAGALSR